MKKVYKSPSTYVCVISHHAHLMETSMTINSSEKVNNQANIGFTKENSCSNYNVWDEDWTE